MNNLNQPINPHKLDALELIAIVVVIIFAGLLIILMVNIFSMSKKIHDIDTNTLKETADLKAYLEANYTGEIRDLIEGQNNPYLGTNQEPQVTIVEFSDFACNYCKEAYPIIRQLAARYSDQIKIIFRDRPGYENSMALALAARCAGEQGKFWEMHDKLYQRQSATLGNDAADLITMAQQLNLDIEQLAICIDEQRYIDDITNNMIASESLNVAGTPTWFVNGQKIEGVVSLANWEKILDQLLD